MFMWLVAHHALNNSFTAFSPYTKKLRVNTSAIGHNLAKTK
jgi:hypothetical protein